MTEVEIMITRSKQTIMMFAIERPSSQAMITRETVIEFKVA